MSTVQNISRFVSSVQNFFGTRAPESPETVLSEIRWAMIECLGEDGCAQSPHTLKQILFAGDVAGLWYVRSDVLAALAAMHGEVVAREKVHLLSSQFQGVLPESLFFKPIHSSHRRA